MAFEVTFTLQDAYARRTTRRYASEQALIADVITDTAIMLAALEGVSKCAVVKTEIGIPTTYTTEPSAGANVDAGATIHVRLDNGKLYPLKVPAVEATLINTDGSMILTGATKTFTDLFMTGTGTWSISEGDMVQAVESGELDR